MRPKRFPSVPLMRTGADCSSSASSRRVLWPKASSGNARTDVTARRRGGSRSVLLQQLKLRCRLNMERLLLVNAHGEDGCEMCRHLGVPPDSEFSVLECGIKPTRFRVNALLLGRRAAPKRRVCKLLEGGSWSLP